ncbi:MAG: hypothetical protein WA252_19275 [Candidatus Sulfotelmatobacter sp.]
MFLYLSDWLMERNIDVAQPPPQLHQRRIVHDGRQPSGHLCLSPELVQVRVSRKKGILNRIFCVSRIAQDPIGPSVKRWQTVGQNLPEFLTHDLPRNFAEFDSLDSCVCALHARPLLLRA